ncbi:MAG: DNA polymerase III subunit delta, partial [Deltaproteobacteria bacterium]
MPLFKRTEFAALLEELADPGRMRQVYLIFGERFLCRQMAAEAVAAMLPDERQRPQQLISVDGDNEDPINTLNILKTYSLFGGRRVIRVNDSRLFFSKNIAKNVWEKAVQAYQDKKEAATGRYLQQLLAMLPESAASLHDLQTLTAGKWQDIFGFSRPTDIDWLSEMNPVAIPPAKTAMGNIGELYMKALEQGLPEDTVLLLLAETVDKRTRLFTFLKKIGGVLDASVETGSSRTAQRDQSAVLSAIVKDTLKKYGKTIGESVLKSLLDRVGFHPVAAAREAEKLALYADDTARITSEHLDAVTCRSKEDALFELTEAIIGQKNSQALMLMTRLREGGMHPLAIIAGLRNFIRKLLLASSLQQGLGPQFKQGIPYPVFQKTVLPLLKEHHIEELTNLPSHPFALYSTFLQASLLPISKLLHALNELLEAEYRLKSSPLAAELVLDNLLFQMLRRLPA